MRGISRRPVNSWYFAAHRAQIGAELAAVMHRMFERQSKKVDGGQLKCSEQIYNNRKLLWRQ